MKTGYLAEEGRVVVKEFDRPAIKTNEVLIRVTVAGICGSDVHAYHGTHPFRKSPMILGHEVAGEVVEVGEAVTACKVGDRVTVEPQRNCGTCRYCKEGKYNICETKIMAGVGGWLGSFAEYFAAPEKRVFVLPDTLDYEVGLLAEPLAVGTHAARVSGIQPGEKAIVLGSGPIGLLAAVALGEVEDTKVFCTDINEFRLNVADHLGIHTINVNKESMEEMKKLYAPDGFDVVILTVSSARVVDQALHLVRRGGRVVVVSVFSSDVPMKLGLIQMNEIQVRGTNTYTKEDFNKALEILVSRREELRQVITQRISLEEINEAMDELTKPDNEALKIVVQL